MHHYFQHITGKPNEVKNALLHDKSQKLVISPLWPIIIPWSPQDEAPQVNILHLPKYYITNLNSVYVTLWYRHWAVCYSAAVWASSKKVKVKQPYYKPGQALWVPGGWGSQITRQLAHEGGKGV